MTIRIFSFLLLIGLAAFGQPFYIDQLNSRNVLIGDDSQYPPMPLNGTLRFMEPLIGNSSNAAICCIEDADPSGLIKAMVFGGASIGPFGSITSGDNFYGYGLFLGTGAHTTAGWDPITQVWFGDGNGLTNIPASSIVSPPWITGNQTITLSGDATGSGTTAITVTVTNIQPPIAGASGEVLTKTATGVQFSNFVAQASHATNADNATYVTTATLTNVVTNYSGSVPLSVLPTNVAYLNSNQLFIGANTFANRVYVKTNTATGLAQTGGLMVTADAANPNVTALYIMPPFDGARCFLGGANNTYYSWDWGSVYYWVNVPSLIAMKANTLSVPYECRITSSTYYAGGGDIALEANSGDAYICGPRATSARRSMMFYSVAAISDANKMNGCFMFIASNTPAMWTNWHTSWNKANSRTDYIMTLDMNGNLATAGTMSPTNGVINQVNRSSSNAVTMVASKSIYLVNGTNQLITLPSASSSTGVVFRVSSTNGWGSFIITNANGTTSIRDGTSLSYTNIGIGEVGLFSDGAAWWLASKARTILPSASWSSATTITPAQDTITNIPWTDLEYNNSQGITLRTNATFVRPTQLWVTNSGTYMITFSAVLKGSVGGSVLSIWLRRDGSDVVRTRTDQGFTGASAQQCMTVNYFVSVGPPTYFELCAASHDASPPTIVGATANPTGYTAPAMPAIIVTINRVSDPWP